MKLKMKGVLLPSLINGSNAQDKILVWRKPPLPTASKFNPQLGPHLILTFYGFYAYDVPLYIDCIYYFNYYWIYENMHIVIFSLTKLAFLSRSRLISEETLRTLRACFHT